MASLPSWIYLRWVSQILSFYSASKSTVEANFILSIIKLVINDYPQSIYFPMQLTVQDAKKKKNLSKGLDEINISLSKYEQLGSFTRLMDLLTFPQQKFRDIFNVTTLALLKNGDIELLKSSFIEFEASVLNEDLGGLFHNCLGKIRKHFIKKYKKTFVDNFGINGELIKKGNTDKLISFLIEFRVKMTEEHGEINKCNAEDISEYLNRFDTFLAKFPGKKIELMGQFNGLSKPSTPIYLVGCSTNVMIMSSLRRPKVLTFYGSNEKDYKFLIKGGEDLRLDQRIEEIYSTINQILTRDNECSSRELQLACYQVIPLNNSLGMVSWIPNSTTLKSISNIDPQVQEVGGLWNAALCKKLKIDPKKESNVPRKIFIDGLTSRSKAKGFSREEAIKHFDHFDKQLPNTALRDGIMKNSSSKEAFLIVRKRFASSFATLSVANYILGIGDRHLDNFVFIKNTGFVTGIDFGAAFGAALNLPIPEMMPIRLTKQILGVFSPFDGTLLLKGFMKMVLAALRKNRELIFPVMSVFINEPIAEWTAANKLLKRSSTNSNGLSNEDINNIDAGVPENKVNIAKLKLQGGNTANIMIKEMILTSNTHNDKPYFDEIKKIITGSSDSKRYELRNSDILSVSDQIDCLIDHSTDKEILARSYVGWAPFN